MAGEIQWDAGATGVTSYANLRNSSGAVYNLLSGQFETSGFFSGSYSGAYPISGTEQGITAYFTAPFPNGVAPGFYNIVAKQQGGIFPVQTDISIANGNLYWTGSGIQTFPTNFNDLSITTDGKVTLASGSFSGQPATLLSGQTQAFFASGSFNAFVFASGVLGCSGNLPTAWGNSGAVSVGQNLDKSGYTINSGQNVVVPPSSLSGLVANSGLFVTVPIASISGAIANSGLFVTVLPATLSGLIANSGLFVSVPVSSLSGIQPISGATVSVPPASLSGLVVNSGLFTVANSGLFATVPISSISGLIANSGLFVTIPIASISGANSIVPPASLSGVVVNSGLFVSVPVSSLSGIQPISGTYVSVPASSLSGITANSGLFTITGQNLDKSGYTLSSSGLDTIQTESGLNMRQAQSLIAAATAGRLSGAGTTSITMAGAGVPTNRLTATVDLSGNRTIVSLNPPA